MLYPIQSQRRELVLFHTGYSDIRADYYYYYNGKGTKNLD